LLTRGPCWLEEKTLYKIKTKKPDSILGLPAYLPAGRPWAQRLSGINSLSPVPFQIAELLV
jgi:hypothetical protein